jgi:hypothetical protein
LAFTRRALPYSALTTEALNSGHGHASR